MKEERNDNTILREALSRLAVRQSAPPEGMTDRFMQRLVQEKAITNVEISSQKNSAKPNSRVLKLRVWAVSAAAVAIFAAIMVWPQPEQEEQVAVVAQAPMPYFSSAESFNKQSALEPIEVPKVSNPEPTHSSKPHIMPPQAKEISAQQQQEEREEPLLANDFPQEGSPTVVMSTESEIVSLKSEPRQEPTTSEPTSERSNQRPQTYFTAYELELDRRATQAVDEHTLLYVGEILAVQQMQQKEYLIEALSIFQQPTPEQPKPIRI